jgi:D-aminopeptidase
MTLTSAQTTQINGIFAPLNRSDAPGAVVAVSMADRIVYRKGFGLASVATARGNSPTTRMRIGSTSKQFTALAMLLLADEGLVDIDAPTCRYIDELPRFSANPSLRQLLNHTSGYRCHVSAGFLADGGRSIKPAGWAMSMLLRQSELNFAPGERWLYSNGGYHLLSEVIARVSGQPFAVFLREQIFQPLGMRDTELVESDFQCVGGTATLHVRNTDGRFERGMFPHEDFAGEGGIVSTVDDLSRWLAQVRSAHLGSRTRVGTDWAWQQMFRPASLTNGASVPYGMGLLLMRSHGHDILQHAGAVVGGTAQALTVPALALDIAIVANGATIGAGMLASSVLATMLGREDSASDAVRRPLANQFKGLVNQSYHAKSGLLVKFVDTEGILGLSVLGNPPIGLRTVGNSLELAFVDSALGPIVVHQIVDRIGDTTPDQLDIGEGAAHEIFRRLQRPLSGFDGLRRALAGSYRCPDLRVIADVAVDGDALVMNVSGETGTVRFDLEPMSENVLLWRVDDPKMPQVGAMTVERMEGRAASFKLDTWTTRHLRFFRHE